MADFNLRAEQVEDNENLRVFSVQNQADAQLLLEVPKDNGDDNLKVRIMDNQADAALNVFFLGGVERPWVPTDSEALLSWYDASDADTITESGGNVSQWDDKSVNGYDLAQGSGGNQPSWGLGAQINGMNVINFNQARHAVTEQGSLYGACLPFGGHGHRYESVILVTAVLLNLTDLNITLPGDNRGIHHVDAFHQG